MDGSPKVSITIFECYPYYPVTTPPSNPTFVSGKPGRPGNPVHNFVIWIDLWHHLLFFPPPFVSFVFISKTTTTILSCPVNPVDPVNPHHFVIWHHLSITKYISAHFFAWISPSALVNSQNIFCSTMQPGVEHWILYYSPPQKKKKLDTPYYYGLESTYINKLRHTHAHTHCLPSL